MLPQKDLDPEIAELKARVEQLEHFSIEMSTSQPQPLPELSDSATTAEVRTAVIEILAMLRTIGLGA